MPQLAFVSGFPRREIAPPGASVWGEEPPDAYAQAEAHYFAWLQFLQEMEALFKKHVYEAEEPSQIDFRLHRQHLYAALAWGESAAVDFSTLEGEQAANYVKIVDEKIASLRETLAEWHGATDDPSIPQSFRQGLAEAERRVDLQEFPE